MEPGARARIAVNGRRLPPRTTLISYEGPQAMASSNAMPHSSAYVSICQAMELMRTTERLNDSRSQAKSSHAPMY